MYMKVSIVRGALQNGSETMVAFSGGYKLYNTKVALTEEAI